MITYFASQTPQTVVILAGWGAFIFWPALRQEQIWSRTDVGLSEAARLRPAAGLVTMIWWDSMG